MKIRTTPYGCRTVAHNIIVYTDLSVISITVRMYISYDYCIYSVNHILGRWQHRCRLKTITMHPTLNLYNNNGWYYVHFTAHRIKQHVWRKPKKNVVPTIRFDRIWVFYTHIFQFYDDKKYEFHAWPLNI